ncbi:hypothetical protein MRX96_016844 [Rhipicephalus microplus]
MEKSKTATEMLDMEKSINCSPPDFPPEQGAIELKEGNKASMSEDRKVPEVHQRPPSECWVLKSSDNPPVARTPNNKDDCDATKQAAAPRKGLSI